MKVITLLNEKGGTGKTTLTQLIAAALAEAGKRVLILDTDPQGHQARIWGFEKQDFMHEFLTARKLNFNEIIQRIPPSRWTITPEAVSGEIGLIVTDTMIGGVPGAYNGRYDYIEQRLAPLHDHFDYVLIDSAPSPGDMMIANLLTATHIILPTLAEPMAIEGLNSTVEHIDRANKFRMIEGKPALTPLGIVVNRYRANVIGQQECLKDLRSAHGRLVWQPITQRADWANASALQMPITAIDIPTKARVDAENFIRRFYREMGVEHVTTQQTAAS